MTAFKVGDRVRHTNTSGLTDTVREVRGEGMMVTWDHSGSWVAWTHEGPFGDSNLALLPSPPAARAFAVGDRVEHKIAMTRGVVQRVDPSGDIWLRFTDGSGMSFGWPPDNFVLLSAATPAPGHVTVSCVCGEPRAVGVEHRLDGPCRHRTDAHLRPVSRLCSGAYAAALTETRVPEPVKEDRLSEGVRREIRDDIACWPGGAIETRRDMSGRYRYCKACHDEVERGQIKYLHRHDCRFALVTGAGRRAR